MSFFWLLLLLLILVVIAFVLNSPTFKGKFGEFLVNNQIKKTLDPNKYHLLENVTLPTEDGTTQIDHIVVSIYGIFVIETKNMKGWIFGGKHQKVWTQSNFKKKNKFQNPLHQNYKHTKTLSNFLGITGNRIHSLVVFVGDAEFKTPMPENVVYRGDLIPRIQSKVDPVFTEEGIGKILELIEVGRYEPTRETHRAHIKHVQDITGKKASSWSPTGIDTKLNFPTGSIAAGILVIGMVTFLLKPGNDNGTKAVQSVKANTLQEKLHIPLSQKAYEPLKITPKPYKPLSLESASEADILKGTVPINTQKVAQVSKPVNHELELAQQACNTAIAAALYDQSDQVLNRRDRLCEKYQLLRAK